jgi:hypothetical protein
MPLSDFKRREIGFFTGDDFNDALLVKGPAFWARLVEKALPQA